MMVTKVSRTYQKSINTKNYGIPESWIKIEATYEAQCESQDDPVKVSEMMYEQAKNDVILNVQAVLGQIQASLQPKVPTPPAAGTQVMGSVPTTPAPTTEPRAL